MEEDLSPLAPLEFAAASEVVAWCAELLVHKARLHLGLYPDKGPTDPDQARLAMDAASALVELLQGKLPGETLGELLMHIADLRLRYLQLQQPR
ncbi:MAG: hypothetical protein N0A24_09480 [Armatimonadetes bacterium]|nr:hypothetical protein [Armatimonadota bacterium]MDW8154414.1 hypothetical protein [Armatimonadota bacterium]